MFDTEKVMDELRKELVGSELEFYKKHENVIYIKAYTIWGTDMEKIRKIINDNKLNFFIETEGNKVKLIIHN